MTSLLQRKLPWRNPLEVASVIPDDEPCWALLYSGMQTDFTGRYSVLALKKDSEIKDEDFSNLSSSLSNDQDKYQNAWFGYLGYGLKNVLENLPEDESNIFNLPRLWLVNYRLIIVFDHHERELLVYAKSEDDFDDVPDSSEIKKNGGFSVSGLNSNMTRQQYIEKVSSIKEAIASGDLYQANLTRKFSGKFDQGYKAFDIFLHLSENSPAPYSSFLKLDDKYVISSSPERFLTIDQNGYAESRPIKGSAARFDCETEDQLSKENLENSEKDKAENLMIVDLMRNDFSRSAARSSVEVKSLYDISSYATVHHMSSTVSGQKREEVTTVDFVKNCFPPGSMTGTPKIKAMEMCSDLEKQDRGVYSGAIGWFGGDGSADLSVVIRTLIVEGDKFEFQVGGAIVADSDPILEWQETMIKAKAIANTLGISIDTLENL